MEDPDFERSLVKFKESLEKLAEESKRLSEDICSILTEHDGSAGETAWSCRTMNTDIEDVISDLDRRLRRFREGDLTELPTVLIMAIECCERLQDRRNSAVRGKKTREGT